MAAKNGVFWERAPGSVHMLCGSIALLQEVTVQTMATLFHGQEHSQIVIQSSPGVLHNGKTSEKEVFFRTVFPQLGPVWADLRLLTSCACWDAHEASSLWLLPNWSK